jgi:hypothetical protein
MSALTLEPRLFDPAGAVFDEPKRERIPRTQPGVPECRSERSGASTLEDVIVAGWEQITAGAAASCPVCHGELHPVWPGGSRPLTGCCQDCGSRLS